MKIYSLIRAGWLAAIPAGAMVTAMANDIQGPSSSATPYLLGSKPGAVTVSILTVGDSVNLKPDGATPYRMAGIPDGLGAFDNGDGTFTLLMNHELTNDKRIERAHGGKGAFVSKWVISKQDLTVVKGQDLIEQVVTWDPTLGKDNAPAKGVKFSRFCSADLPELTAFYNPATGLGYNGRIFMNGEENGKEGRAFAHLMNGTSYELPYLGKFAWENAVAHPNAGDKTIVVGTDDGPGGQVYVYSGEKTSAATAANEVEAAGLTGGDVYGISVAGLSIETDSSSVLPETTFTCYKLGDVSLKTGDQLETASAGHVTTFNRPEDGCWDPVHPNDFYFVTTASFTGKSRLWRLHFTKPANPPSAERSICFWTARKVPR